MSLIATRIQNWRVANPNFDRNLTRPLEYGALDFFIEQTGAANSIISPQLRTKAFASIGSDVQIPVINYDKDVTVSNTRSCVVTEDENTSALYTVVWQTLSVGFTMIPSLYMNNEIDYAHDFQRKMEKVTRALANRLDQLAVASLEANKTQVFVNPLYYQNVGNSLQVPWDMRTEILGDMRPIMRANSFPNQLHIIGNAGIDSLLLKLNQHGEYNDVNKRLEFADKIMHYTNNVVNEDGKFGTVYAVEDGNVGVLTRVDREALRRASANGHEWDQVRLPYIDLPVGAHYYTAVGDFSSVAGEASADMTCVVKEFYGFSVDVAFLVAYNSDPETLPQPIVKAEIASSDAAVPTARPVVIVNDENNPVATTTV